MFHLDQVSLGAESFILTSLINKLFIYLFMLAPKTYLFPLFG